jgi:hypothetical protein
MSNITPIDNRDTNPPKNGWLWVQDHSPELVKLYFLSTAINDWFFWHCVMNKHDSETTKNYKCDLKRTGKLIDLTTVVLDGCSHRSSNWLNSLLWEQGHSFPWESIVGGAIQDNKSASEDASSLFYWPPLRAKEKRTLEDHVKKVFKLRCAIYNGGNYHDSMNWLDIYDMELHDTYRNWIVSQESELLNKIRSKLRLVKIHAAVNKGQAKKQWMTEASYLGLTKKQAADHWHYLWEYISAKTSYHRIRIDLIEKAVDSPFRPRRVQSNTAELTQTFSRQVVDFSEARIDLFADVVSLDNFENVYFL